LHVSSRDQLDRTNSFAAIRNNEAVGPAQKLKTRMHDDVHGAVSWLPQFADPMAALRRSALDLSAQRRIDVCIVGHMLINCSCIYRFLMRIK
jgi:hypothetical protein